MKNPAAIKKLKKMKNELQKVKKLYDTLDDGALADEENRMLGREMILNIKKC